MTDFTISEMQEMQKQLQDKYKDRQLSQVQRKIKNIDPKAFLVVTDAYDTYGEGFKPFPEKDTVVE